MAVAKTHCNKSDVFWNELKLHVLWYFAGGGKHMEVEVIYWNVGRQVEPQPVEENTPMIQSAHEQVCQKGIKHYCEKSVCFHLTHSYTLFITWNKKSISIVELNEEIPLTHA